MRLKRATFLLAAVTTVVSSLSLSFGTTIAHAEPAASISQAAAVTEYYNGGTYQLSPGHWHGASACAIVTPTVAYCFDNASELNTFTATPAANPLSGQRMPDGSYAPDVPDGYNCSGYTKIWNGVNWTNTGLAFKDWGYAQNLNSYTPVPFRVISWFSDGQRAYGPNSCPANIFQGSNGTGAARYLPANAEAKNMGTAWPSYSIELYKP